MNYEFLVELIFFKKSQLWPIYISLELTHGIMTCWDHKCKDGYIQISMPPKSLDCSVSYVEGRERHD